MLLYLLSSLNFKTGHGHVPDTLSPQTARAQRGVFRKGPQPPMQTCVVEIKKKCSLCKLLLRQILLRVIQY